MQVDGHRSSVHVSRIEAQLGVLGRQGIVARQQWFRMDGAPICRGAADRGSAGSADEGRRAIRKPCAVLQAHLVLFGDLVVARLDTDCCRGFASHSEAAL